MFFCSFVKIIVSQKFVFFKLHESPRRLRETKKSISGSKYSAPFASLRENKNMLLCSSAKKNCEFRELLSPHKFGQRLSVPCENKNMFFYQQNSAENQEFLVTSNLAPKNQNLTHPLCQYFSQI